MIIALALILGLAAFAASAWSTDNTQHFSLNNASPILLDFGSASVTVLAWEKDNLAVSYTDRSLREGLRGDIRQAGNSFTLDNYVAPVRTPVTVQYSADNWLPMMQFEPYRHPYLYLPRQAIDADYIVYVPRESRVGVSANTVFVSDCTVFRVEADQATVTDSHLSDDFVGIGQEVLIRRSSSADFATIYGGHVIIRDSRLNEINIRTIPRVRRMQVDINNLSAVTVGVHAEEPHRYFVSVDDANLETLNLFYGGGIHTTVKDVVRFSAEVEPIITP